MIRGQDTKGSTPILDYDKNLISSSDDIVKELTDEMQDAIEEYLRDQEEQARE